MLRFDLANGLQHVRMWGRFVVDGIEYTSERTGVAESRLMIQVIADDGGSYARMRADRPPTEAELDMWVQSGWMTP